MTPSETETVFLGWLERARAEQEAAQAGEIKRDESRTNWVVPVDLVLDEPGGERHLRSRTRDISNKGLGVHCREEIPLGRSVRVYLRDGTTDEQWIEGRVNHCTMTVGGYKIGIQIGT